MPEEACFLTNSWRISKCFYADFQGAEVRAGRKRGKEKGIQKFAVYSEKLSWAGACGEGHKNVQYFVKNENMYQI